MSLQIEAGKFYRDCAGDVWGPMVRGSQRDPCVFRATLHGLTRTWSGDGRWGVFGPSECDLAEDVPDPDPNTKIELEGAYAATYRTHTDVIDIGGKPTNPKDAIGVRKWRNFTTVPQTVLAEVGAAMLEGAMKYGRHNYRVAGVRSSVYIDATMGHLAQWWEGEDLDPDTGLSHITKALASLFVLRDAMIQDMLNDDRPPKAELDQVRDELQSVVDAMFEKHREPKAPFTELAQTG